MNIKNEKGSKTFILKLIKIRENKRRTPLYTSDVTLNPNDIKDMILNQRSIFHITSKKKAKEEIPEILNSIKDDWAFTDKNRIDKNILSWEDLPNGNIRIKGFQTEILDRYLLQKLGVDRKNDTTSEVLERTPSKNIKMEGDTLTFGTKIIPTERGQKTMAKLFLDNAEIYHGKRLASKGKVLTLDELQQAGSYKDEESFRDGLKKQREKIKDSGFPATIDNKGTKKYQMVIKYIKKQK